MDNCEGCLSYDKYERGGTCGAGVRVRTKNGLHCPCSNCLIKVMCNSGCEKFLKLEISEIDRRLFNKYGYD